MRELSVLFVFLFFFSCVSAPPETKPKPEVPISSYKFEDLPIPPGFVLNKHESFIYESSNSRAGILIYNGEGDLDEVVNFFKENMPQYEWNLLSSYEYKGVLLNFSKEGWNTIINIKPKNEHKLEIEIRIGPIGSSTTEEIEEKNKLISP